MYLYGGSSSDSNGEIAYDGEVYYKITNFSLNLYEFINLFKLYMGRLFIHIWREVKWLYIKETLIGKKLFTTWWLKCSTLKFSTHLGEIQHD